MKSHLESDDFHPVIGFWRPYQLPPASPSQIPCRLTLWTHFRPNYARSIVDWMKSRGSSIDALARQLAHDYRGIGGRENLWSPRGGDPINRNHPTRGHSRSSELDQDEYLSLDQIKRLLRMPNPMKNPWESRDQTKYYHFYRDYGHDTKGCHDLQNQTEELIRKGYLRCYVKRP
ncbi:hypothetical protein B296_00043355 [Ensete ventricosum]|uniref:Uncharacterized protein n=1 Tax=Ensete ventricosum TaxID=4639 RepID=A0A426Y8K2_ENSVE|nr:hypothetical protein B296_00043355 [Ensete ventricosum]